MSYDGFDHLTQTFFLVIYFDAPSTIFDYCTIHCLEAAHCHSTNVITIAGAWYDVMYCIAGAWYNKTHSTSFNVEYEKNVSNMKC